MGQLRPVCAQARPRLNMGHLRRGRKEQAKIMPEMKIYKVGWRAYWPHFAPGTAKPDILGVGWDIVTAPTVERAMEVARKRVPGLIGHPGCEVGIRYVKEKK